MKRNIKYKFSYKIHYEFNKNIKFNKNLIKIFNSIRF